MTPIISPWVFYAMQVCDSVVGVFGLIAGGLLILFVFLKVTEIDEGVKFKHSKQMLIAIVIFGVIAMLCPTQSTLTKMLVAQNVTYERVEMVGDTVQDVYEDIISLVDGNEEEGED